MSEREGEPEPGPKRKPLEYCPHCHQQPLHRVRRVGAKPIQFWWKCLTCLYERQIEEPEVWTASGN